MRHHAAIALAAALIAGSTAGDTSASETRPGVEAVVVRFLVNEPSPERLVQALLEPAQRALMPLAGVTAIAGTAAQGYVSVEVRFEGSATEKDVATVSRRIEELMSESDIPVKSRTVVLAPSGL